MGTAGDSNVPCQSTSTSGSTSGSGSGGQAGGCGSNSDCLYGNCKFSHTTSAAGGGTGTGSGTTVGAGSGVAVGVGVGVCITPNKTCATNVPGLVCSGHGACRFTDGRQAPHTAIPHTTITTIMLSCWQQ